MGREKHYYLTEKGESLHKLMQDELRQNEIQKRYKSFYPLHIGSKVARIPMPVTSPALIRAIEYGSNTTMRGKSQMARFILNAPIVQKTERASMLVKLLEGMDSDEQKAVFMAQILRLNAEQKDSDI